MHLLCTRKPHAYTLLSCVSPLITLILVCICLYHLCCNHGLSRTISAYGVSYPTCSLSSHGYIERCARYCLFGYVQDFGFVYTETSCLYFGLSFLVESNASIINTMVVTCKLPDDGGSLQTVKQIRKNLGDWHLLSCFFFFCQFPNKILFAELLLKKGNCIYPTYYAFTSCSVTAPKTGRISQLSGLVFSGCLIVNR
jgi:hypothetical protein